MASNSAFYKFSHTSFTSRMLNQLHFCFGECLTVFLIMWHSKASASFLRWCGPRSIRCLAKIPSKSVWSCKILFHVIINFKLEAFLKGSRKNINLSYRFEDKEDKFTMSNFAKISLKYRQHNLYIIPFIRIILLNLSQGRFDWCPLFVEQSFKFSFQYCFFSIYLF